MYFVEPNNETKELIKRVEAALIELHEKTGAERIDAMYWNGSVIVTDYTDLDNKIFDYYEKKEEANNE